MLTAALLTTMTLASAAIPGAHNNAPAQVADTIRDAPTAPRFARADDDEDIDDNASSWAPIDYYTSMGLDDDLHPEVEDEVVIMWVMAAILPLGEFWLPYVFGDPGDGYFADMVTSYGLHGIGYLPVAVAVIPFVGWAIAYAWLLGYSAVLKFWLHPVAMLNLYSRSLYRADNNALHPLVEGGHAPVTEPPERARAGEGDEDDAQDDYDDRAEDAGEAEVASPPRQPAPVPPPKRPAVEPLPPTETTAPTPDASGAPGFRAQYAY